MGTYSQAVPPLLHLGLHGCILHKYQNRRYNLLPYLSSRRSVYRERRDALGRTAGDDRIAVGAYGLWNRSREIRKSVPVV